MTTPLAVTGIAQVASMGLAAEIVDPAGSLHPLRARVEGSVYWPGRRGRLGTAGGPVMAPPEQSRRIDIVTPVSAQLATLADAARATARPQRWRTPSGGTGRTGAGSPPGAMTATSCRCRRRRRSSRCTWPIGPGCVGDIADTPDGLVVAIRRSKTDQEGEGETVGLPYGSDPATCPVRAYRAWLAASGIAAAWRESAAAGIPLSGAQLAERFGRSPRWGRQVIAECREAADPVPPAAVEPERHEGGTAQAAASPAVRRVTTLAVLAVALVAAVASYDHRRQLAAPAGEEWRAWLLSLSVDGLVIAASMSMLVRRRAGLPAGALAWCALLLGVGASLAANVAAAEPTVAGRLVAAWPPLALLLAYELAMQQARTRGG